VVLLRKSNPQSHNLQTAVEHGVRVHSMSYDKVIVSPGGAEFPYSDLSDDESYYYEISVVFDDRDGELFISKWGSHIAFDDDGSWLDFKIAPDDFFPNQKALSHSNILSYMETILTRESEGKLLTREDVEKLHKMYLKVGQ
jgi:hypothetical protein